MSVTTQPPWRAESAKRYKWVVDVRTTERFEWSVYDAMREWLTDNLTPASSFAVATRLRNGRSIRHVAFTSETDAVLFYLRFA